MHWKYQNAEISFFNADELNSECRELFFNADQF